jgi:hypothetical protein
MRCGGRQVLYAPRKVAVLNKLPERIMRRGRGFFTGVNVFQGRVNEGLNVNPRAVKVTLARKRYQLLPSFAPFIDVEA